MRIVYWWWNKWVNHCWFDRLMWLLIGINLNLMIMMPLLASAQWAHCLVLGK